MVQDSQYNADRDRLAELLERHTKIPRQRTINFIKEYGAGQILPCANKLCTSEAQRKKLVAVFEFKNAYEKVKQGDIGNSYILDSRDTAMEYFCNYFADTKDREYFVATYLNNMHEVISTKVISAGSINSSAVYPREILKEALFCNASGVMVAHNHPSGSLNVSIQDSEVTKELRKAFESTGVQLLDHFVVAGSKAVSIDDTGNIYTMPPIPMAASPAPEKAAEHKPPRIREQLAMAQMQMELDGIDSQANTKRPDRGER